MKIRPRFTLHGVAWDFFYQIYLILVFLFEKKQNFIIVLDKSSSNLYTHTKAKSQMNNDDLFFLNVRESVEIPEYKDERLNHENRKLLNILTKNHTFNF